MRHRKRGRTLGRSPSHQRALLRSLATNLFLTADEDYDEDDAAKVKGRIVTTLEKAKEVRPLVEKCITVAKHSLEAKRRAEDLDTDADRHSEEWKAWRNSERYQEWNAAVAPVVTARRRVISMLSGGKHAKKKLFRGQKDRHTKRAVQILFEEIAPRYEDRPGGYTRIVRLATPRLGDGGARAILEFVGQRDRVKGERAEAPSFEDELLTEKDEQAPVQEETAEAGAETPTDDTAKSQGEASFKSESEGTAAEK